MNCGQGEIAGLVFTDFSEKMRKIRGLNNHGKKLLATAHFRPFSLENVFPRLARLT